jgi:biopolymer transport protein ExbB
MRELYEFLFVKGGPTVYALVFVAVLALAIFLERLWALQRRRVLPPGLPRLLRRLILEGRVAEAAAIAEQNASTLGAVLAAGTSAYGKPREIIKERLEDAGGQEIASLERYMNTLGTIGGIATLLGLFGTVLGMISVFQRVSESVGLDLEERTRLLSSGIYEVLINTAGGLFIAVCAIVAHTYLSNRINALILDLEAESKPFVDLLHDSATALEAAGEPIAPAPAGAAK